MQIERFDGADLKVPVRILVKSGHYSLDDQPDEPARQVVVVTFESYDSEDQLVADTYIVNLNIAELFASSLRDGVNDVKAQAN